jgi:hypothetical protein
VLIKAVVESCDPKCERIACPFLPVVVPFAEIVGIEVGVAGLDGA